MQEKLPHKQTTYHCNFCKTDLAMLKKVADRYPLPYHLSQKQQSVLCACIMHSKARHYFPSCQHNSTSRQAPKHHRGVLEPKSHSVLANFGLFFNPGDKGRSGYTKKTLNSSHTAPFLVGSQDELFLFFGVADLGLQNSTCTTIFA